MVKERESFETEPALGQYIYETSVSIKVMHDKCLHWMAMQSLPTDNKGKSASADPMEMDTPWIQSSGRRCVHFHWVSTSRPALVVCWQRLHSHTVQALVKHYP